MDCSLHTVRRLRVVLRRCVFFVLYDIAADLAFDSEVKEIQQQEKDFENVCVSNRLYRHRRILMQRVLRCLHFPVFMLLASYFVF